MGSFALTTVRLLAVAFLERATLAKAVTNAGALLGSWLEGCGLAVHCHDGSGVR